MDNIILLKYIKEHQLASFINNTKWKKLVSFITSIDNFEPTVNIKTVFDKENNGLFGLVWWEEIEKDGFNLIEWLEINPVKSTYIGKLVEAKTEDYTEFVEGGLKKNSISYEVNEGIIKVYGYKRAE